MGDAHALGELAGLALEAAFGKEANCFVDDRPLRSGARMLRRRGLVCFGPSSGRSLRRLLRLLQPAS
jgi:hypothetical protein